MSLDGDEMIVYVVDRLYVDVRENAHNCLVAIWTFQAAGEVAERAAASNHQIYRHTWVGCP
jgi:hypothetical protein